MQRLGNQVTLTEAKMAGSALGVHAGLLQIRGDWAFYKEVFAFPSWAARKCCWRCGATNSPGLECDFRDATLNAAWRAHRYRRHEFIFVQRASGICPSTLFQSPGVSVDMVMIDWLHTMDQGVLADIIGNVLWDALPLMGVRSRSEQVKVLWAMVKTYYAEAKVQNKLDNLTEEMIKVPGKAPKQRGKAAQARYLLPFATRLAESFADMDQHWQTVALLTERALLLGPIPNMRLQSCPETNRFFTLAWKEKLWPMVM